jgi:hypothetical protein
MTNREMVVLQTFLTRVEADLAAGALHASDIDAMVSADDAGGVEPGLWPRGVRLMIWPEDAERAREALSGASSDDAMPR